MEPTLRRLYLRFVLPRPLAWTWVALALALGVAGALLLPGFKLSAGTSTLVLEGDDAKRVYDDTRELFVTDDYVLVSVEPREPWTPEGVRLLDDLTRELATIDGIASVTSPSNVPLFRSDAKAPFRRRLLTDPETDLAKARAEMTSSHVYGRQLVSDDGSTFLLVARFGLSVGEELRRRYRAAADAVAAATSPDPAQVAERDRLAAEVLAAKAAESERERRIVGAIREVLPRYAERGAEVHASGLPALVVDMVTYLEHDILVFGFAVTGFLVATLVVLFRRPRFVVLPIVTCLIVVVSVLGMTVAAGTETTVVTSNMSSLLFLIGMAHSIHLVVKYREERALRPERPYRETIAAAAAAIWEPCLYTALTTCVGFASILTADIGPVQQFAGWMAFGTIFAFAVSLVFLPAALSLLPPTRENAGESATERRSAILAYLARLPVARRPVVFAASAALTALAVAGALRVTTDTRFVNYFRSDTEVHQGIDRIDRVGGTMTLEVILHGDRPKYWLDEANYARVEAIHRWFEARPEPGKTLSLVSFREEGRGVFATAMPGVLNAPFATQLGIAEMMMGKEAVQEAVRVVADGEFRTTRVYVRIRETADELRRTELLDDVREFLATDPRLAEERAKPEGQRPVVTGMFVLFTNMLASLLGSQVSSLWWCVLAVAAMLALLFRHVGVALIAMPPNLLPIALVLGTMGFAAITLDLMTIMIASVSLGMAVDSSIHYVVRFRDELRRTGSHEAAVAPTHQSIGKAILYTAFTVVAGFCVLVLSRFTPTIYFGVLTAVAMVTGLLANLILLPSLLLAARPWRRGAGVAAE